MFKYYVSAPCKESVGVELGCYKNRTILTPAQMRRRVKESFALLKSALSRVSSIVAVTDRPKEGAAFVVTAVDVSDLLRKLGLNAVALGPRRGFSSGATYLFFVRATLRKSPKRKKTDRILLSAQKKITRLIQEEFGGEPGPERCLYFIAEDPDTRWLPYPPDRKNAWVVQMQKIEAALKKRRIPAEIGIRHIPRSLSLS